MTLQNVPTLKPTIDLLPVLDRVAVEVGGDHLSSTKEF